MSYMLLARFLENLSYLRLPDPREEKLLTETAFFGVTIVKQLHTKTPRINMTSS